MVLPLAFTAPVFAQMGNDAAAPSSSTAPTASTDTTYSGNKPNGDDVAHRDKSFAEDLATGSTNEVALSQLADSHASNADVKSFAQMMVTDHTQLNSKLSDLAQKKGLDLSSSIEKGQKKGVSSLSKKNGGDFDKAYIKQMVKGHKDTADLLKDEAADSKDPEFQQLANEALPTVLSHLQKAQDLEKTLENGS